MTLANKITLSRIILGPLIFISIVYERTSLTLALFALNIISDGFDGFIARKRNEKTKLGEVIDPLIDLLFFSFGALGLYLKGIKEINLIFIPFTLIIISFFLSKFTKEEKLQVLHSKTKYLHTPFLYFSAIFIILNTSFWKPFFILSIIIFSASYFELLLRSISNFLANK